MNQDPVSTYMTNPTQFEWLGIVRIAEDNSLGLGMPFLGVLLTKRDDMVHIGFVSHQAETIFNGHAMPQSEFKDFLKNEAKCKLERVNYVDACKEYLAYLIDRVDDNNIFVASIVSADGELSDITYDFTESIEGLKGLIQVSDNTIEAIKNMTTLEKLDVIPTKDNYDIETPDIDTSFINNSN